MKTINYTFKGSKIKFNAGVFKIGLLSVCLSAFNISVAQLNAVMIPGKVMEPESIKEQKLKSRHPWRFGTGFEIYNSKDLHGTFYSLHFCMIKDKSTITLGPVMQKRTGEINGAKIAFSYLLSDDDETNAKQGETPDILQLKMYTYLQYLNNAKMSYKTTRVETLTNPESHVDYNNLRFSTAEAALCAELDFNLKNVCLRTYAGFSVFHHFNYDTHMFHERTCAGLVFGAGICLHK